MDLPSVGLNTLVPDYYDVNEEQYINARIGYVSNGTLNIDIGEHGAAANSSICLQMINKIPQNLVDRVCTIYTYYRSTYEFK